MKTVWPYQWLQQQRTMYGSDQSASLEPSGINGLVEGVKKVVSAMGEEKIGHVTDDEKKIADKLRQHINVKIN